ncbi:MAG: sulfite exporter TauE/SafE family protein [Deltaproteobacteria bacterium]|nr:sulfite exporter TauE/SafE family protein [Deltaproteobacteria bacterium]
MPLFFLTALIYSTVGLGGGSTYLALLVLFSIPYQAIPKIGLICNLIVVTGGCFFYIKEGHFSFKKTVPFVLTSIPFAYLGGRIPIQKEFFQLLLGFSLLAAAVRMLLAEKAYSASGSIGWKKSLLIGLPIGALLGLLSGLVGIGGGIFLSPLLCLLHWTDAKGAAASASFFILVNSLAGLSGQIMKSGVLPEMIFIIPLGVAALLGGQIGSRLGSREIPKLAVQRITSILIFFVAGRLLWNGFL